MQRRSQLLFHEFSNGLGFVFFSLFLIFFINSRERTLSALFCRSFSFCCCHFGPPKIVCEQSLIFTWPVILLKRILRTTFEQIAHWQKKLNDAHTEMKKETVCPNLFLIFKKINPLKLFYWNTNNLKANKTKQNKKY